MLGSQRPYEMSHVHSHLLYAKPYLDSMHSFPVHFTRPGERSALYTFERSSRPYATNNHRRAATRGRTLSHLSRFRRIHSAGKREDISVILHPLSRPSRIHRSRDTRLSYSPVAVPAAPLSYLRLHRNRLVRTRITTLTLMAALPLKCFSRYVENNRWTFRGERLYRG